MLSEEELSSLHARYEVGTAMTFEEMNKLKQEEREYSLSNPFDGIEEENPYLFEDKPVGLRRYAIINAVGPGMAQQHKDGLTMIKVKAATSSLEHASNLAVDLHKKSPEYHVFLIELFKFVCVPPPAPPREGGGDDIDKMMNDAIKAEYDSMEHTSRDYRERKNKMLNEVKRHNEINSKIAAGELPPEACESASICPEAPDPSAQEGEEGGDYDIPLGMEPDAPVGHDSFLVLATLKVTQGPLTDRVIYKICGIFEKDEQANAHMTTLKKSNKYKLFDVCVCHMYCWLQMPPPYHLIENVQYDSTKLTEALGARKKKIDISSIQAGAEA